MTATQKIYALLSADAGVTALVPAARIKPAGDWQNLAKPYIVHFPVTAEFTRTYDGPQALRFTRHQVSIFADLESTAEGIAEAVVTALDGHYDEDVSLMAAQSSFSAGYDTDLKVAHYVVEFEIAGALT
jgi:hypothetical protein